MRSIFICSLLGAFAVTGCSSNNSSGGDSSNGGAGGTNVTTASNQGPSTGGSGGTISTSTAPATSVGGGGVGGDITSSAGGGGLGGGTTTSAGGTGGVASSAGGAGGGTTSSAGGAPTTTTASSSSSATASSSTASSTVASSSSSSSSVASSSTGPVCTPPISGGACDTFPQCGCEAEQNCDVLDSTGTTVCKPIGAVPPYGNCTAFGQCGKGYQCVGSVCTPYCATNNDCPGAAAECIQVTEDDGSGTTTPIPADYVCTSGCNPVDPQAICGVGTTCSFYSADKTQCFGPAGFGTGANGCTATTPDACAAGYVCLTDNSCAKWCRIGHNDCSNAQTCMDIGDSIDGTDFGYCD